MRAPVHLSVKTTLQVPPGVLWAFLADTDRINRAVGIPRVRFLPDPDPGRKGHYQAEIRLWGWRWAYEEFPFDWVEGRYYHVLRRFRTGPLGEVSAGVRLTPTAGGATLEVFATVVPRHRGLIHATQLEVRLAALRAFPIPEPLIAGLQRHLLTAGDLEVVRMRPFEVADRWGEDRTQVLRLFLFATKAGLLDLSWTVLCPHCRAVSAEAPALSRVRAEAHCATCQARFAADLAASVEVRFTVNPAVRLARHETYCIGGPANAPQIVVQWRLGPGERRREALALRPGAVRIRCFQAAGLVPLLVTEGAGEPDAVRVSCEQDGLRVEGRRLRAGAAALEAVNALDREALLVVERETWREGAATAALVTSLQDFRDLFPAEAVAPGEELGIASLAVLFTDLRNSTALYQQIGDPRAFAFVKNHFRYAMESVARHRGGVVKTMGDAVMAAFPSARDALEAAAEMQARWGEFRRGHGDYSGLCLKIGVHQGPAIAINNEGRLDYFGATINMAARVQQRAQGLDVVFTEAVRRDPEVDAYLKAANWRCEVLTVSLKGIEGEQTLYQIWPTGRPGGSP
ncbi:MAG: adenylate/guanylate cyclase domain-containing protein [Candidatus Rokubacteria bacterium]|nr:adenylate/guanylate cyclase domain-containing protein [Candidatus Rokubacteria bacterium]